MNNISTLNFNIINIKEIYPVKTYPVWGYIVILMNDRVYRDRGPIKCVFTVMCFDVQYLIKNIFITIFSNPEVI